MASTVHSSSGAQRLLSIDVLRGFDMFWIVGADEIAHALHAAPGVSGGNSVITAISRQLEHVPWEGFVFYDLIFPLFVFLMGVSVPFAVDSRLQKGFGRGQILLHALWRFAVLYFLGFIYYGGFSNTFADMRFVGVLQRIAICYLGATAIYLYFRPSVQVAWLAAILLGYWALMALVPFRPLSEPATMVSGIYSPYDNLAAIVDRLFLPGKKWFRELGGWDPEGLLSTLPAVGTALMGVLAGEYLLNGSGSGRRRSFWLVLMGLVCVGGGLGWSGGLPWPPKLEDQKHEEALQLSSLKKDNPALDIAAQSIPHLETAKARKTWRFPVIKKIWTSSYVLLAGGLSLILLGVFHYMVDVIQIRWWVWPLAALGANSIAVYMMPQVLNLERLTTEIVPFLYSTGWGGASAIVPPLARLLLIVAIACYLYQKRIFIKI